MDIVTRLTLEVLEKLRERGGRLAEHFPAIFRTARSLDEDQRAAVAAAVHGVVRSRRLLDFAIDRAVSRPLSPERRDLARLLARNVLDERETVRQARRRIASMDWERVVDAPQAAAAIADPAARLGTIHSLPDWLAASLIAERGAVEAEALARALGEPAPLFVRANRIRTTREALIERLRAEDVEARPTALASDGLAIPAPVNVFRLPAFHDGLLEAQDEGSQLVSELVAPPPGGTVIDFCAGAGGKTLHLGALLGNRGRVIALDAPPGSAPRLEELRRRARRAGLSNVQAIEIAPAGALPPALAALDGRADRVLVDAPCTGTGVLRRNPEARWTIEEADVARLAALQLAILERAAPLVAPGGRLVYATCSLLAAENDDVVARFRSTRADFVPVPAKEILGKDRALRIGDGECLRLSPHTHEADGFFAAVLRRAR